MKYTSYILLLALILGCSSDDDQATEQSNTLIIKHIKTVGENNERNFYFDINGRLDSITDSNALSNYNYILSRFEYSNDDKLINSYHTYGTEELFSNLTYSNGIISNYYYITLGASTDSPVSINGNTLNYTEENSFNVEDGDLDIELTFTTDHLKYITQLKTTLTNDSNSVWGLTDYEYDNNLNRISRHTTVQFGSPTNYIETFVYDDKKNPIAESMSDYRLALYFMDAYNSIEMSPNNILSKENSQGEAKIFNYIYNNDDYPISATITDIATNTIRNTITYTYY